MWFHHLLFFLCLSHYGITGEVIRRRPWQTVWSTMQQSLVEVERQLFWMGFFYLAWGHNPSVLSDGTAVTGSSCRIVLGALDERGQPSAQQTSQHHSRALLPRVPPFNPRAGRQ